MHSFADLTGEGHRIDEEAKFEKSGKLVLFFPNQGLVSAERKIDVAGRFISIENPGTKCPDLF